MTSPLPSYEHPRLDWDKLKTLVHYICHRAPNPKDLGATKLNKILFYSDMEACFLFGRPITGEVYVKRQFGPVPKHIQQVLGALEQEEALAIGEASGHLVYEGGRYTQRQFFSLRRPSLSLFSGEEISIVDETVEHVCLQHSAQSISRASHNIIWELAEIGEIIPYYTAYARLLGEVTEDDMAWARARIAERRAMA